MSNIKAGSIASIISSEENVFILSVNPTTNTAEVRRPTMGQNGIEHRTETFTLAELETPTERRSRIAAEQMELRNLFQPKQGSVETSVQ